MEPERIARRIFDAYRHGDLTTIQALIAPDVTLHVPGRNKLAGDYVGPGEVIALVARASGFFEPGSLRVLEMDVNEGEILARVRVSAGTLALGRGYLFLNQRMRPADDGRIREAWVEPDHQQEWDDFVGRSIQPEG